ncbi:hypothetical protein D3C80_1961150 [compost metagenome]
MVQLLVGDLGRLGRVVTFPDDGGLVAAFGQVAVQTVRRQVKGTVFKPADADMTRIERGVLH